ncbi:unnamed protein product [Adineta ricciae]|uniref:Uncharacterized protein n=1 Tax=Adineta ricciae TaxID=249248 RepID=A0A816H355_ADIRI|nr:unnamed protein product [Adineta ricciae]
MIKGRFNYDEGDDLVYIFPKSDILYVLLSSPTSDKEKMFTRTVYLTDTQPTSLNNDGIEDLAVLHWNEVLAVFIGTNADLNQDQKDNLITVDNEKDSIRILLASTCDA